MKLMSKAEARARVYAERIAEVVASLAGRDNAALYEKTGGGNDGRGVVGMIHSVDFRRKPCSFRFYLSIVILTESGELDSVHWFAKSNQFVPEILAERYGWRLHNKEKAYAPGF